MKGPSPPSEDGIGIDSIEPLFLDVVWAAFVLKVIWEEVPMSDLSCTDSCQKRLCLVLQMMALDEENKVLGKADECK
jgi:hypothetical protein